MAASQGDLNQNTDQFNVSLVNCTAVFVCVYVCCRQTKLQCSGCVCLFHKKLQMQLVAFRQNTAMQFPVSCSQSTPFKHYIGSF